MVTMMKNNWVLDDEESKRQKSFMNSFKNIFPNLIIIHMVLYMINFL